MRTEKFYHEPGCTAPHRDVDCQATWYKISVRSIAWPFYVGGQPWPLLPK